MNIGLSTIRQGQLRPAVATILVFSLLGPPIGCLTLALLLPAFVLLTRTIADPAALLGLMPAFARMFVGSLAQSFLEGGMQAFVTGSLFSAYGSYRGKPTYTAVSIAAILAWAGFIGLGPERDALEAFFMLPVHLVPALICARLTMAFWPDAE